MDLSLAKLTLKLQKNYTLNFTGVPKIWDEGDVNRLVSLL